MLKRDSVYDIMGNLIPSCKAFTINPPQCTCAQILHVTRCTRADMAIPAPYEGHCSIRAAALPEHLAPLKQCLKNVPTPTRANAQREVRDAFTNFYRQLNALGNGIQRHLLKQRLRRLELPFRWLLLVDVQQFRAIAKPVACRERRTADLSLVHSCCASRRAPRKQDFFFD